MYRDILMVGLDNLRGLLQPMILWFYDLFSEVSDAVYEVDVVTLKMSLGQA